MERWRQKGKGGVDGGRRERRWERRKEEIGKGRGRDG